MVLGLEYDILKDKYEKLNIKIDTSEDNFTNNNLYNSNNIFNKKGKTTSIANSNVPKTNKRLNSSIISKNVPLTKDRKNLGKKRLFSDEEGEHDNNKEDNLIRKSKNCFHHDFLAFINEKIKEINEKKRISKENKVEELLNLGPSIDKHLTINANLTLFDQPIRYIFGEISKKYKDKPKNYNQVLIDKMCNNGDYKEIEIILNTKYLDCLKHYRKEKKVACLNGLEKKFEEIPLKMMMQFERGKEQHLKKYQKLAPKDSEYDKNHEMKIIDTIKKLDTIYQDKYNEIESKKEKKKLNEI